MTLTTKQTIRRSHRINRCSQQRRHLAVLTNCVNQSNGVKQTVTGYITDVNCSERRFTLKFPPSNTGIMCYWNSKTASRPIVDTQQLVQITGDVVYKNDRETPQKITCIDDIRNLDMSNFILTSFTMDDDKEITLKAPLILTPQLTESCQHMTVQKPEWGILATGQTRSELLKDLTAEFLAQWDICVNFPDEKLSDSFRAQKHNLLSAIK